MLPPTAASQLQRRFTRKTQIAPFGEVPLLSGLALGIADQLAGGGRSLATTIVGYGFRDALWPDHPDRAVLDQAAARVPVVLISADLHSAWLNTAALRQFREPDHPTGLLREEAAMRVIGEVAVVAEDVGDAWAADAARAAAARGIVGIVDMERPWPLPAWRPAHGRRQSIAARGEQRMA